MLSCKKTADSLLDFLENNLGPEEAGAIRTHLEACAVCMQFMESYKKTTVVCRRAMLEKLPASGDARQRLMDFLRRECGKSGK